MSLALALKRCFQIVLNDLHRRSTLCCERKSHLVTTAWHFHGAERREGSSGAIDSDGILDTRNGHAERGCAGVELVLPLEKRVRGKLWGHMDQEQLKRLMEEFRLDRTVKRLCREHLITGKKKYHDYMTSFAEHLTSNQCSNSELRSTVASILDGSATKAALFPFFLSHAQSLQPLVGPVKKLLQTSHLSAPASWFPAARAKSRKIVYHAGPTNSGKTHEAMQHFKAAKSAVYCAPLRLLAHEIFHRCNKEGASCDLLTGEEAQFASECSRTPASRLSCTIEMAFSTNHDTYDVCVIDEIQMIADPERGGAWTRALLGLPAKEIHVCGHECAIELVKRIAETAGDTVEVHHYERLSPLVVSDRTLKGSFGAVKPGDCVVTFSRRNVFEIGCLIEKTTKQTCAVVYGDLPPAVRVKQTEMFNDPSSDCNVMVATDAIGMGLNLNIGRIIFHSLKKFDGDKHRNLTPAHARQVAGRAGRYGKKHSKGFVTTFQKNDFRLLQSLLRSEVASTEKAGLYPTVDHIELFSAFIPQAKLHQVLALFCKLAELDGNYFLCDLSDQIELAYKLRNVDLDLQDIFQFTLAPVDLKKQRVIAAFVEFGECFAGGHEVSGRALYECLGRIPKLARTPLQLAELEMQHEMVNLYLWLSMRFPETFVDSGEAHELQEDIEQCISQSLEQGPSLKPSVRQRWKRLSKNLSRKLSRKQWRRHH